MPDIHNFAVKSPVAIAGSGRCSSKSAVHPSRPPAVPLALREDIIRCQRRKLPFINGRQRGTIFGSEITIVNRSQKFIPIIIQGVHTSLGTHRHLLLRIDEKRWRWTGLLDPSACLAKFFDLGLPLVQFLFLLSPKELDETFLSAKLSFMP